MSSKDRGFKSIVKGSISIPISCPYGGHTFYGVYSLIKKSQDPSDVVSRLVFRRYSDFEKLSKRINCCLERSKKKTDSLPSLPKGIMDRNRENLEKYIKSMHIFLDGNDSMLRDPFTEFVTICTPGGPSGYDVSLSKKVALDEIKKQRENDHNDLINMIKLAGNVPTPYGWHKALFCFLGYESSGKSSLINDFWKINFRKIGDTQTDTGYTIIESVTEDEFKKVCPGYEYKEAVKEQIIEETEGFRREDTVFTELDSTATLNRYDKELDEVKKAVIDAGSPLKSVLINERYLPKVLSPGDFQKLRSIIVLDSCGINPIKVREKDSFVELTTFFIRNCTAAAILCSEQSLASSCDMYKFFCECALRAYRKKEENRKILENFVKLGINAFFGQFKEILKSFVSMISSDTNDSCGSPGSANSQQKRDDKVEQTVAALENIMFFVTKMDNDEAFQRKAYELGLMLGKGFESPPVYDNVFFVSLKEGSKGKMEWERILEDVKTRLVRRNPSRVKDERIKLMADVLKKDGGFLTVDLGKLERITENVSGRLKMWDLGILN